MMIYWIKGKLVEYIANKVRILDDPCSNAFIRLKNKTIYKKIQN
jgi:hypothetical protein